MDGTSLKVPGINTFGIGSPGTGKTLIVGAAKSYDLYYYGIEYDVSISSPTCTRVGMSTLHSSLPIQSGMRACLLFNDGSVNYYLNPLDWSKKINGQPSDLSGVDGQVMIEIPSHYMKFESSLTKRRRLISEYAISGFEFIPKMYISAFEASLDRTNLRLSSVVNVSSQYRGGGNQSAWDALSKSMLGKPVTDLTRTQFRTYARSRASGWEMYSYIAHKVLTYLFTIEYATLNSQLAVNNNLTTEGFKQGGLGVGVSEANSSEWTSYCSQYPFISCGVSNSLANASGEVNVTINDFGGTGVSRNFKVNRYRGIENPFAHVWKNIDGANVRVLSIASGDITELYGSSDRSKWNDQNNIGFNLIGLLARTDGYIKEMIPGEIMPITGGTAGGSSSTFWCDNFFQNIPASGENLRTILFGGYAAISGLAGFTCSNTNDTPASIGAYRGTRLCFHTS